MDELDYRDLYRTYPQKGRKPETDPVIMAKIVVYAYSQRTFSTREIEKSCRYDLRYHYLLQRQKAPDHNTICRFIRDHLSGCLEDLLNQLIRQLAEAGEISFEQIFLDGTKVEANANRYTFIWRGTVEKNQENQHPDDIDSADGFHGGKKDQHRNDREGNRGFLHERNPAPLRIPAPV